jgi:hypothetical protein
VALVPNRLLLSRQTIRLFPAAAPTGEVLMEKFAAEGGFRLSAARTDDGRIDKCGSWARVGAG